MVLIQDRILKIDIYNFEMSYKTPEKSLKSNQIYSEGPKTGPEKLLGLFWDLGFSPRLISNKIAMLMQRL